MKASKGGDAKKDLKPADAKKDPKSSPKPESKAPKKKPAGGLLKKLADAKEVRRAVAASRHFFVFFSLWSHASVHGQGLQIKLAHASRGKPDSIDTQTNDSLLAGAEEQSALVVSSYRAMIKAGKTVADKQDAVIRTGSQVAQQLKACADLARAPQFGEYMQRLVQQRERECELDAMLMNGFSNGLVLALEDFVTKKERDLKNSKLRYDQSLGDYGVAVRKAQVRLGKGPEHMNATRYLKAAVGREICLHNYEQVTSEHLAEHRRVDESRNLEVFTEFHRAQEAQIKFAAELGQETAGIKAASDRVLQWAHAENERLTERMREAARDDMVQEEARLWDSHDDFVRFMTLPNVMTAFLKTPDVGATPSEAILAAAFDTWGLSENVLLDLMQRNPPPDDSTPLFTGHKAADRLLSGYVRIHFGAMFTHCFQPMLDKLTAEPERYAMGKPQGLSAALTLTELTIERICDTMDRFPPLFARLCQVPGAVPPLIGGRVFKTCLTMPERFGATRLSDPGRTTAEVIAFLLWEILRGRSFAAVDAARAQQLKMNLTVAHHVSEGLEMLRAWASSPTLQLLRDTFGGVSRAVMTPSLAVSVDTKLASVREGGSVHALLANCRVRQDALAGLLLEMDRAVFFKFCDLFQKASVASVRGTKRDLNESVQLMMSGENSAVEDDSASLTDGVDFKSFTAMSLGSQIEEGSGGGGGDSGADSDLAMLMSSAPVVIVASSSAPAAQHSFPRTDSNNRLNLRPAPPSPLPRHGPGGSPAPSPGSSQYAIRALVSPRPAVPSQQLEDSGSGGGGLGVGASRPAPPPVQPTTRQTRSKSSEGVRSRPAPPTARPHPQPPPPGTNSFATMRKPHKPVPETPTESVTPPLPPKKPGQK